MKEKDERTEKRRNIDFFQIIWKFSGSWEVSLTRELKKCGSLHIEKKSVNKIEFRNLRFKSKEIIEARSSASAKSKKLPRFRLKFIKSFCTVLKSHVKLGVKLGF